MHMETTIGANDRFEVNVMRVKGVETIEITKGDVQTSGVTTWRKIVIGNLEINLFEEGHL